MKVWVVVNPVGAEEKRGELEAALRENSVEVEWIETTEEDPGVGQAKKAAAAGAELVIVCGGDGTVRACAEGLVSTDATLGVIPAGTGNLLARNKGIPEDLPDALEVALNGHHEVMDVGRVGGEVFTVMAGAGIDAAIMDETSSEAKDRLGVAAYILEGAKHLFDEPFQATVSGKNEAGPDSEESGSWATVLVGNLGQLQGGVDIFPEAESNDGFLDLVGLKADGVPSAIAAGTAAAVGSTDSDRLFRAQAAKFTVEFATPTRYELDGEARDEVDRLTFKALPSSLRLKVPHRAER